MFQVKIIKQMTCFGETQEIARQKNAKLEILLCPRQAKEWIIKIDFEIVVFIG